LAFGLLAGIAMSEVLRRLAAARDALPKLLKHALRRNEIYVEFQPIVDMTTGCWVGAEALARWRRPNGEIVPPDVFVPLAEEYGLIRDLTKTVLESGLRQMAALLRSNKSFFIAFNVSAEDLREATAVPDLLALVERHQVQPCNVQLEITERQVMNGDSDISTVAALRSNGFKVGTDDFGIGCSNLGYLNAIPLDYVKIDRSFVINPSRGNAPFDIVDTIVRLAKARGIENVAEGVEVEGQQSHLVEMGVRLGQGWLFGKPMSASEFISKLANPAVEPATSLAAGRATSAARAAAL
jgi:sensor c-di-GMP phosphodiesterase-like protein